MLKVIRNQTARGQFDGDYFDDAVDITIPLLKGIPAPEESCTSDFFLWKGINWNVLVKHNNNNKLSCYVGYENDDVLPSDLSLRVKATFRLSATENFDVTAAKEFSHVFRHPAGGRCDQGFGDLLESDGPLWQGGCVNLRITMIEEFVPVCQPVKNYSSKKETGMVGLENLGATCYLNSLLQMLFHVNAFRETVYKLPHKEEVLCNSTTLALQKVFKDLQLSDREVSTRDLTRAFGWTTQDAFLQQDVQEMMRILLDKLEEKMKDTVVDGAIRDLFSGYVRSFIRCVDVTYESKREEPFYDIQLDVKGCRDIYDSLRRYTSKELLEGENQYDAAEFGKRNAEKGVIFTKLPPVLTIHLKRFDFNIDRMGFVKIHDFFEFPTRLCMKEFLADDADPQSVQFNSYILHSVLVHAGDVGSGHYYAYIRPSGSFDYASLKDLRGSGRTEQSSENMNEMDPRAGQWFKFNDEIVQRVPPMEAVNFCFGKSISPLSSAYMLVYIRESDAAETMKNLTEESIPADLRERLDNETSQRKNEERKFLRDRMYIPVPFATESHIAAFADYSRDNDFFSISKVGLIKVMTGSQILRVLLTVSKVLDINPNMIRLWSCSAGKGKNATIRATGSLSIGDLTRSFNTHSDLVLFVEKLPPADDEQSAKLQQLLDEEKSWVEDLRCELEKSGLCCDIDSVEGCGVGSSNKPLNEIVKVDKDAADALSQRIDSLQSAIMGCLNTRKSATDINDECIIFFRAFDPDGTLPVAHRDGCHPVLVGDANPPSVGDSEGFSVGEGSPMPMRYLGSKVVPRDVTSTDIAEIAKTLLMKQSGGRLLQSWENFTSSIWDGRGVCLGIDDTDDEDTSHPLQTDFGGSGDIVVIDQRESERSLSRTPSFDTSSTHWIRYMMFKKTCHLNAMTDTDETYALSRIKESKTTHMPKKQRCAEEARVPVSDVSRTEAPQQVYCTITLATHLRLGHVFDKICSRLHLAMNRLALFMTFDDTADPRNISPLVCADPNVSVIKSLSLRDQRCHKSSNRIFIWFKVLPFPLFSDTVNDYRNHFRFMEFLIVNFDVKETRRKLSKSSERDSAYSTSASPQKRLRSSSIKIVNDTVERSWGAGNWSGDPSTWSPDPELDSADRLFMVSLSSASITSIANRIEESFSAVLNQTHSCNTTHDPLDFWSPERQSRLQSFSSESLRSEENDPGATSTVLAILLIRGGVVDEILKPDSLAKHLPAFWCEAMYIPNLMFQVALQWIPRCDWVWMTGGTDTMRSSPISVFNFTLLGGNAQPCDAELFSGPFLSYIKEDDTVESLFERFSAVTGENDDKALRLAIIVDRVPYFIPRTSSQISANESTQQFQPGDERSSGTASQKSTRRVWDYLTEKYNILDELLGTGADEWQRKFESPAPFPQFGIQRSSSDVVGKSPRTSSNIKISG